MKRNGDMQRQRRNNIQKGALRGCWGLEPCGYGGRLVVVKTVMALLWLSLLSASAQSPSYGKLSPLLRRLAHTAALAQPADHQTGLRALAGRPAEVCAFVAISADGSEVLSSHGCRELAHAGRVYIASIPIDRLAPLSLDRRVCRIEARQGSHALMDSMAIHLNAQPVYDGLSLPQPYTGRGVVMGVMDVGFDLTHPTFYDRTASHYRISRLWDQLSADTVGSSYYVGRDYASRDELLTLGHSRDGLDLTHGTHTLGIAAGSGYDSPYRGMAPEADLCIVANAVTDDMVYIDSADVYKYTYATDALGFKYIFDYADSVGSPCVISFSEGSGEDFWGYDVLYYEFLESLCGPGHIIVASAGNQGLVPTRIHKPLGQPSAGAFLTSSTPSATVTLKSASPFALRFVAYTPQRDTLLLASDSVLACPDSIFTDTLRLADHSYALEVVAYSSCYDPMETCYDLTLTKSNTRLGNTAEPCSIELLGGDADVELYRVAGQLTTHPLNPALSDARTTHNIHSPSSAPCVICVGNTAYCTGHVNYRGEQKISDGGTGGVRTPTSSVGPAYDGRTKPEVMAPGMNIISAYSSYYIEAHPDANDVSWDVAHFDFQGRTYAWNSNSGTSMSAPAVGGTIALWLQACPQLTPQQALDAIAHTSSRYDESLSYPNNEYGYGQIDVYRGLLYLLGLDAVKSVSHQPTCARVWAEAGRLSLSLSAPAASELHVQVLDLSGRPVLGSLLPAGQSRYDVVLPALSAGVYAVQIGGEPAVSGSALVRLP